MLILKLLKLENQIESISLLEASANRILQKCFLAAESVTKQNDMFQTFAVELTTTLQVRHAALFFIDKDTNTLWSASDYSYDINNSTLGLVYLKNKIIHIDANNQENNPDQVLSHSSTFEDSSTKNILKRGVKTKVKMEALSDWREDYVWEADEEKMEKEVKEKKVKNKIIINPKLGEAVEEIGGEVLEIVEMEKMQPADDPQLKSKENRQRQLKKQVLLRKLQAVRQTGGEDITASYEPEGEQVDEVFGKLAGLGALAFATQRISSKLGTMHGNRVVKQALSKSPATSNSSSSSGGSNFQRGVNAIKDAKKSGTGLMNKSTRDALKMLDQYEPEGEQLDEYGNPRVGVRLRVARAIDKTNPKPRMGSKRSAISNKLKMSAIKAETKRREQQENPYSAGKRMKMVATSIGDRVKQKAKAMTTREDYIPEEEYDHYKDRIAMAGGDPSSPDKKDATTMPRRPEKPSKGMTAAQKAAKGRSALDIVKADIRKKYGKGAIMDVGKK
mgnify:CR=1 FL=1